MRPVSLKRAAQYPKRRKAEADLGRDSDGNGSCWRCGRWGEVHGHEREGGSRRNHLKPDCLLCNPCNEWCQDEPARAAFTGWKISAKARRSEHLEPHEAWNVHGEVVSFQ